MPDTPSITLVTEMPYRGKQEQWSNTYHFNGSMPTSAAEWRTLFDAIAGEFKKVLSNQCLVVKGYGYEPGNENSVWQHDRVAEGAPVINGTYAGTAADRMPGDCAATVRWYTGRTSSRGKKIYCRKYFHDVYNAGTGNDNVASAQATLYLAYANKLIDGTLPGTFRYCAPQGASLSAPFVSPYVTTRTLKRRGKRPPLAGGP